MKIRSASLALLAGLTVAAPTAAFAAPSAPIVQVEKKAAAPVAQSDANSYEQREQQDKAVQNYEGGSTVVIAMSGGALVVLLFLLLIL